MDKQVYIVSACRTPIGAFCGAFLGTPAHELGGVVIKESLKRAQIAPEKVSELIMGQALTAGQGQNTARMAGFNGGLPQAVTACGVNMLCGSGLKAIQMGYNSIKAGDSEVVVAGGQENMSMARHTAFLRSGIRLGPSTFEDSMHTDGLVDTGLKMHMGETVEFLAQKYKVPRKVQDEVALKSQNLAEEAMKNGYFEKEIVGVQVKKGRETVLVKEDEYPKHGMTLEKLQLLRPVFSKESTASVTAGNASGINDGAACVVLASGEFCTAHSLTPLASVIAFATSGLEPIEMGLGPVMAVTSVLKKANWSADDVDLYELNEAFAVQAHLCVEKLNIPKEKVNITGGAIALGHPIGASGARVLVTLLHNMERLNKKKGVASLCVGGGMGIAIAVERKLT